MSFTNNRAERRYDAIGQLKTAQGFESDGVTPRLPEQWGYAYDKAWNLSQRTNDALVEAYSVNPVNELSGTSRSGTLTVAGLATGQRGNLTGVTVNGQAAAVYSDNTFAATNFTPANGWNTYTAIAQDIYGRWSTNTSSSYLPSSVSYAYDLNGNLLGDGTRSFAYDDENELISVWQTNLWRCDFVYDGKLRRRIEKDYNWTGSAWQETNEVHFIYDGNLVIQERNSNNVPLVTYTRGSDLSGTLQGAGGIGGLLARTDANGPAFYHADGNGNITCLIDTNQFTVAKYLYDPYGFILSQSGPIASANSYRFSSKEWNANAGLYYYLYRFYDPSLQRWVNRDLLSEVGFEVLRNDPVWLTTQRLQRPGEIVEGADLYEFVINNTISGLDSLGLASWWSKGGRWGPLAGVVGLYLGYEADEKMANYPGNQCSSRSQCNSCCQGAFDEGLDGLGLAAISGAWGGGIAILATGGGAAALFLKLWNDYEQCVYKCQSHHG